MRAVLLAISAWFSATSASAQTRPWAELTKQDLQTIRETILQHHPGPVDPLNPSYRSWLDSGYAKSLAMADSVRSMDGLVAVVSYYSSGFQDGHLGWSSEFVRRDVRWPGIILARRGGRYVVSHVAAWVKSAPAIGSQVLSCGDATIEERMAREVMSFSGGIYTLEASRTRLAPSLLVADGNPWRTRPTSCHVRENGVERDVQLEWRWISVDELEPLQTAAAYGVTPKDFTLTRPQNGVAWITVPSFGENVNDNRIGLESLVRQLPSARDARLIVFDVRGNHGGNSYWGAQLLTALFDSAYIAATRARIGSRQYIQWRASGANADFIKRSTLPRFEKGSAMYKELAALVDTIRRTLSRGENLTSEPSDNARAAATRPIASRELGSRVVLLTDGWCGSACLDFADMLLAIPGVRHAGAATYADAVYIDNRSVRLPSDLGWFGFSMKVYRNRLRGHNQPYEPSFVYDGTVWDTATLQKWLIAVARRG